jgi:hypothetical protein
LAVFDTAIAHLREVLGEEIYKIAGPHGCGEGQSRIVDVRTRPNRSGPNRAERRLDPDHIGDDGLIATLVPRSDRCALKTRCCNATRIG